MVVRSQLVRGAQERSPLIDVVASRIDRKALAYRLFSPLLLVGRPTLDRLVDKLHVGFVHAFTVHRERGEPGFDLLKLSRPQLDSECAEVLVQVTDWLFSPAGP